MAKNPWFAYGATGKVANVVLQKYNGNTVMRERVTSIKNPRTESQQLNRMYTLTNMAGYSLMKAIVDHSFEGKSEGLQCMREFLKLNYPLVKSGYTYTFTDDDGNEQSVVIAYNAKQNTQWLTFPAFKLSNGSMPTLPIVVENVDGGSATPLIDELITAETTVAEFHDALGLEVGDQITLCAVTYQTGVNMIIDETNNVKQYYTGFRYARLVFDSSKGDELMLSDGALNTSALYESKNADYFAVRSSGSGYYLGIPSNYGKSSIAAGCFIASRKSGDTWLRSASQLEPTPHWLKAMAGSTAEEIVRTYDPSDSLYLNNAES